MNYRLALTFLLCLPAFAQTPQNEQARLKQAVQAAPQSFTANHQLGEFYVRQGQLALAIPYLEKAQQLAPQHYANNHDLALAYFLSGALPQARRQLRQMLPTNDKAELHHLLGEVEEKAGDVPAAAQAYHHAAELEPSEKHLLSLGNLLVKSQNFAEALKFLNYGLAKYPRSSQLKVGLGLAEYAQGEYDKAVATLCEGADLDPADARPYLFLGEMYAVSVTMAEAVNERLARFVKLHPQNAKAHYYYALNLWKGKRDAAEQANLQQIETHLRTAIKLDAKLADAYFQLGSLYFEQQRWREAVSEFRRAIKLQPTLAQAHYRLAQALQRLGARAEAERELEIFRQLKGKQ